MPHVEMEALPLHLQLESVELALEILDGYSLRGHTIHVERVRRLRDRFLCTRSHHYWVVAGSLSDEGGVQPLAQEEEKEQKERSRAGEVSDGTCAC